MITRTKKSQRILFVHPYIRSRFTGAPIGFLYVASIAREAGHEVRFLDLQADPSDWQLTSVLSSFQPRIVGIGSTSPSHKAALDIAKRVKHHDPSITVLKGGVHETYCSAHTLSHNPQIDFSMHGEVDQAIIPFIDYFETGALEEIPCLTYRTGGGIRSNPTSRQKIDLDFLPYPARDLLKPTDYYNFKIFSGHRTTQVQTMRGCPFQCSFCNQRNRRPNVRSIDNVLSELKSLTNQGYEAVFFDDATFTVDRSRTRALCTAIEQAGLGLELACQTRSELVDEETIERMAKAGFVYMSFGLETANEEALKLLLKARSVAKHTSSAATAVALCRQFGIAPCLNLIVGLPNETDDKLKASFEFAAQLDPSYISLSTLALYPHEDLSTADLYTVGVSNEDIWIEYDEGTGAVHPHLSAERASEIHEMAQCIFGNRLAVT